MYIATIRFTTKWPPDITSPIIAVLSGSREFSHSMCIVNGMAYEATMRHGCRVVPLGVAMQGVAYYRDMFVPIPDIGAAIEFGLAQDGKGYDFLGAFRLPFLSLLASDDWADWSKWWCSELNFAMLGAGGNWVLDPAERKRVTPNDLLQCNYEKTEIIKYSANV